MTVKRRRSEKKTGVRIFSGLFFLAGLTVIVLIGISLGKETYRKRQIQKEIESLQTEIQSLNQENSEINNLISYFSTREFEEKEAREKLNLQKEDERMIILRKELEAQNNEKKNEDIPVQAPEEDKSPNWQKWLKYFFAARG
jgi:cell division protein FtsB